MMTGVLRKTLPALGLALLFGAVTAQAAPITYSFTSGTATVRATVGGSEITPVGGVLLTMNGIFVEFDDALPLLIDFDQTVVPGQTFTLTSTYGGFDEITVESATLKPGAGYLQSAGFTIVPGVLFQVTVGPVLIDAVYGASFSGGPVPAPVSGVPLPFLNPSMTATIQLGGVGELSMTDVTIGTLPGAQFGETEDLVIKADIVWQGIAVMAPEPAASLLGLIALAGLVASKRFLRS